MTLCKYKLHNRITIYTECATSKQMQQDLLHVNNFLY